MKSHNRHNPAITAIGAWWLSNVIVAAKAFYYSLAAVRDERNGFPYTAAMEWRQAADLFAPSTRVAEYFWRQWERIMHLPPRLAGPIGISCQPASSLPSASTSAFAVTPTFSPCFETQDVCLTSVLSGNLKLDSAICQASR